MNIAETTFFCTMRGEGKKIPISTLILSVIMCNASQLLLYCIDIGTVPHFCIHM